MINIIVGVKRSAGSFKDENKRTVEFDNVIVYLMDAGENNTKGFTLGSPDFSQIKVKFTEFQSVFGVSLGEFVKNFDTMYQYHRAEVYYKQDKWGKLVPSQVLVSEKAVDELLADEAAEIARREEEKALLADNNQGKGRNALLDVN